MLKFVDKFHYNPEQLAEAAKERYAVIDLLLVALCKAAIPSGQAKTSDLMLMHAMQFSPEMQLFDAYYGNENQFDPNTYAECVHLSVDSVLF